MIVELFIVWGIYSLLQIALTPEPPIWLTSLMILVVDRSTRAIADWAARVRNG